MIQFALGLLLSMAMLAYAPTLFIACAGLGIGLIYALYRYAQRTEKSHYPWLFFGLCLGSIDMTWQILSYTHAIIKQDTSVNATFKIEQYYADSPPRVRIQLLDVEHYPQLSHQNYQIFANWHPHEEAKLGATYRASFSLKPQTLRLLPNNPYQSLPHFSKKIIGRTQIKTATKIADPNRIDQMRQHIQQYLLTHFPDSGAYLSALSVGLSQGISDIRWQNYRQTGVIHLLVISGLHLTIVAGWLFICTRILCGICLPNQRYYPFQIAAIVALGSALGYALMAGFGIPIQRALWMFACWMLALLQWRSLRQYDAIAIAVIIVLLSDPMSVYSSGFWLSFGAVLYFIWQARQKTQRPLWQVMLYSQIILSLLLIPVTAFFFGEFSLISPLANIIAIPFSSLFILPFLLLGLCFLPFIPAIANPLLHFSAYMQLHLNQAIDVLAALPFAAQKSALSLPLLISLITIAWLWYKRQTLLYYKHHVLKISYGLLCLIGLILLHHWFKPLPLAKLTVLPVGEGLSVAIQIPSTQEQFLYDTGNYYQGKSAVQNNILPFLFQNQPFIKGVILSHYDQQHTGGLRDLRTLRQIQHIYAPAHLQTFIDDAQPCSEWRIGHPAIQVKTLNFNSGCAYELQLGEFRVWLLADIEQNEWLQLRQQQSADFIIFPNQGRSKQYSPPSTGHLLLSTTQPSKRFNHPDLKHRVINANQGAIVIDIFESHTHINQSKLPFWWY